MIRTFNEAVKYLEKYIPTPDKKHPGELGIKRMQYLMDLLGNPQLKYPTIHVGGTSGKGSTSTFIASILATKYKVGLHTSPHLVKTNERIEIFSREPLEISARGPLIKRDLILDQEFVALINKIAPLVSKVEKSKFGSPSYFEIVAAMTFLYFYQQKVDVAVIEVGMGGRYDATNVINPLVVIITNVELDHTEILGDSIEKIAEDKVGIIKSHIEVVTGAKQPSVIKIVEKKCKTEKASLSLLQIPPPQGSASAHPWGVFEAFSYRIKKIDSDGSVFDYKGNKLLKNLKLKLLGQHQVENATLAIRAIEVSRGLLIEEKDIRIGLKSAFIPGRLEIIKKKPLVILDGAHNPDKIKALVGSIKKIFPKKKVTSIVAIKNDKNAKEMLSQLLKISQRVIFTKFRLKGDVGIINSYDPEKLIRIAYLIDRQHWYTSRHTKVVKKIAVVINVKKALKLAVKSAKPDDLILVTGSLYLVGEVKRSKLKNKSAKPR